MTSLVAALLCAPSLSAAHSDKHGAEVHHNHEAHVHGAWELFAALDDARLSVTVKGPLVDVLGFEWKPKTDQERSAVADLNKRLKTPELMLTLNQAADCNLSGPVVVTLPDGFLKEQESAAAQGDGETHDHGAHSDHHDHSDHHNDLELTYAFDCNAPSRLTALTMNGFSAFPAIQTIDAVFLSDDKQVAQKLARSSRSLNLH